MTRRAWTALGLAEATFLIAYPAFTYLAYAVIDADGADGGSDLGQSFMIVLGGMFAILVMIPIAVHTAGRLTEMGTADWSRRSAAVAHLLVGLGLGAMGAAVAAVVIGGAGSGAFAAIVFVVPSGIAGFATHLLMPVALRHLWFRTLAWVIAALPIVGAALLVAFGVVRSVT